jgi:hypothetical protein
MSHDSQENQSIRYEKSDTDNRAIVVMGLIVLTILMSISLLMIPFTKHMWNQAGQSIPMASARSAQPSATPEIQVEVRPGSELEKFHEEVDIIATNKKIDAAIQESLKQGFPSRKS